MEHYIVSARKYRPSTFDTVIGQKPLTSALKHAMATDRLAHAYLFCGSRGVGKTSCARIFAKTINCTHRTAQGEACNQCESCTDFNNGTSLNIIELDAASHNGVEDIRSLIEQVMVPPTQGRYRVFIIDEVHMLSAQAFNAFLKTLEEPPEYAIFILATTEKHKIIPTILSRCQIYDFNRITIQDMVDHLADVAAKEGINAERSALSVIAKKADGAMRDALSIFDQVAASTMGNITYQGAIDNLNILDNTYYTRLVEAFLAGDVPQALLIYKEVREKGFDSQFFINGLGLFMRDLMVAYQPSTITLLEGSDEERDTMAALAAKCAPTFIYSAMDLCNTADLNFRTATNKQFLVELTLVKLCQLTAPKQAVQDNRLQPVSPTAPKQPEAPQQPQQYPQRQPQQPQRPQVQQQPAYTPPQHYQQHTAPRPAARQRADGLPSFSLSGNSAAPNTAVDTATEPEEPVHRRSEAYTPEALVQAWKAYTAEHPTERILINTMQASVPALVDGDTYKVVVDDTIQISTLNQARQSILEFLHNKLDNDNVNFIVEQNHGESSPITWTQRDVLRHLAEKHPAVEKLIKKFSLTI